MRYTALSSVVLLTSIALAPRRATASNLLTNPGFETGSFSGWTVTPNTPVYGVQSAGFPISGTYATFGPFTVIVNSGAFAAYAVTCNFAFGTCQPSGDSGDNLSLSQTVGLVAGQTYSIGFYFGTSNSFGFGNSSNITVNGTSISFTSYPPNILQGYQLEDGTFTALSTGPASVSFFLQGSGYGDAGFSFDDFFVNGSTTTPEPSSLLLLASGLIALVVTGALRRSFAA